MNAYQCDFFLITYYKAKIENKRTKLKKKKMKGLTRKLVTSKMNKTKRIEKSEKLLF